MASLAQTANSLNPSESEVILAKNPRGRPAGEGILTHLKDLIENCGRGRKYAETLDQLAIRSKSDQVRLAALSEIMDRVYGKATQRVDMRGIVVMMPAQADLEALDSWAGDEE